MSCEATREGMPSNATLHVTYQANLQQIAITTNPALNVIAHDPTVTHLLEQAAEARHREAMGRAARHLQVASRELKVARELTAWVFPFNVCWIDSQ